MKPLIGILTCGFMEHRQFVTDSYIRAVRISGGLPVLIPALPPEEDVSPYLSACQGFLLPGGNDITPLLFDEEPMHGIGSTNLMLDVFQIHFTEQLLAARKPVLAICRGMQILNAACGGTIYQDLSLRPDSSILHMQTSENRSDISHRVTVEKSSTLHTITGTSLYTNSFHHQSIHMLGTNVTVTARTADDVVEAIELADYPFAIGVQWHPETMFFSSLCMRNLFSLFIDTAKKNFHA